MKQIIYIKIAICLFCHGLLAQDWRPVAQGVEYHYKTPQASFITNTIKVDSVRGLANGDSVFYLNRVIPTLPVVTFVNPVARRLKSQFLEASVTKRGNGSWVFEDIGFNKFVVYPNHPLQTSWLLDTVRNISAQITQIAQDTILGQVDSIKSILLSNGYVWHLSKHYSFGHFEKGSDSFDLVGYKNVQAALGLQYPDREGFWRGQPGDELYFHTIRGGIEMSEFFDKVRLDTIRSVSGITYYDYTIHARSVFVTPLYTRHNPGYIYSFTTTIPFANYPFPDYSICLNANNGHGFISVDYPFLNTTYNLGVLTVVDSTANKNYAIPVSFYADSNGVVFRKCGLSRYQAYDVNGLFIVGDSIRWYQSETSELKEDGIGVVYADFFCFEYRHSFMLLGRKINGVVTGEMPTDSSFIVAGVDEPGQGVSIHPNPTDGLLYVHFRTTPERVRELRLRIVNSLGQEMRLWTEGFHDMQYVIEMDEYPAGMYYLVVENEKGELLKAEKIIKN